MWPFTKSWDKRNDIWREQAERTARLLRSISENTSTQQEAIEEARRIRERLKEV